MAASRREPSHAIIGVQQERFGAPQQDKPDIPPEHAFEGTRPRNPTKLLCPSPINDTIYTRKTIGLTVSSSIDKLNRPEVYHVLVHNVKPLPWDDSPVLKILEPPHT